LTDTLTLIVRMKKGDAECHHGEGLRRSRKSRLLKAVFGRRRSNGAAHRGGWGGIGVNEPTWEPLDQPIESIWQEPVKKQNPVGLEAVRPPATTGLLEQRI